jgi:transcriptional regulator with XRE-family HTH domain
MDLDAKSLTTGQRIKMLREDLGLSQKRFCELLALSSGYIAGVEVNLRPANERLLKLIIAEFGASEQWLRTGEGPMFAEPAEDDKSRRLLALFNTLPEKYQDVILGLVDLLRKADAK